MIALAHRYDARVSGHIFPPDVPSSLARNAVREGAARVPPVAIYVAAKRLVAPEYAESFAALCTVRIAPAGGFAVDVIPA